MVIHRVTGISLRVDRMGAFSWARCSVLSLLYSLIWVRNQSNQKI